ncbi:MAG: hypothetical protein QNJ81_02580 [Acidimicrobiia bacterium]|nr:hypothetical protein [Acidimicrobiia bacterium]
MTDPKTLISEEHEQASEPDINDLVSAYVAIRDALSAKRREFKEFEARSKEDMAKLEIDLLEWSRKLGVNSFKTDHGTAFKVDKDYARVAGPEGWEALCRLMVERNDFGLVEKRVAKLHFKEVLAEELAKGEEGLSPIDMGVEYVVEEAIQVRRA